MCECVCVWRGGDQSEGEVIFFHFFLGNTLTLSLPSAPVAITSSQTLHQPALMQFSTDLCDALRLYVCVHVSWEGCGGLTCLNGFKLCKNKWTPSSSLTLSETTSFHVKLLRRWPCKVICTPITHHTHIQIHTHTSSWYRWHGASGSSRKRDGVRALQRCGWMKRDDLSAAWVFDKRLIITLSWWRCHWGLGRTTGTQSSQQSITDWGQVKVKSGTCVRFAYFTPEYPWEHMLSFPI